MEKPLASQKRGRHRKNALAKLSSPDNTAVLLEDESRFITEYLRNGGNGTAAARKIWPYLTYGSATVQAQRVIAAAQGVVAAYMDAQGLTLDKLVTALSEGMIATAPVVVNRRKYDQGKLSEQYEEVTYTDDFKTRHRFLETALKLRGELQRRPDVVVLPTAPIPNNTISMTIGREDLLGFTAYMMEMTKQKLLRPAEPNSQ